jgi:transposase InsO family protein
MDKYYKEVLKNKKFLDSIFYDKGFLMKGLNVFVKRVREMESQNKEQPEIPYSVIESYYEHQPVVQRFKPEKIIHIPHHIISLLPFERIYCDTMYLTQKNSVLAFVNIVDLFSKFGFSRCFTIKNKTSSISSEKAKITFNDFLDEIKKYDIPVGIVYTDRGSEFMADFQDNLQEKKIIHIYGNAGDKRKTSPVERFNRTIRLYIEKFKIVYGNINSEVLDVIIKSYNHLPHANLKYSPVDILKNKNYQDEITTINYNIKKDEIRVPPLTGYVRVLIQTGTFKKISPTWSHEIYKIKSYSSGNYTLEGLFNKVFKRDELLHVDKEKILEPEIDSDLLSNLKKDRVYLKREIIEKEEKKYNTRGGRVQVKF